MAKAVKSRGSIKIELNPKKQHGRHAKSESKNINSKTYQKAYRGQGR